GAIVLVEPSLDLSVLKPNSEMIRSPEEESLTLLTLSSAICDGLSMRVMVSKAIALLRRVSPSSLLLRGHDFLMKIVIVRMGRGFVGARILDVNLLMRPFRRRSMIWWVVGLSGALK